LARIHALIRRATQSPEPTRLAVGDLTMDLITREVRRGERKIELQPREFALLEYLMRHPNRPVTKTMILEHIFDYSFDPKQTWWTCWCTGCAAKWTRKRP